MNRVVKQHIESNIRSAIGIFNNIKSQKMAACLPIKRRIKLADSIDDIITNPKPYSLMLKRARDTAVLDYMNGIDLSYIKDIAPMVKYAPMVFDEYLAPEVSALLKKNNASHWTRKVLNA